MASLPHTTLALCDHVQRFAYDRVGVGLDSSPHALATAARSLANSVLGDVVATPPADEYAWQWWSGSSEEWFEHGPFDTRDQAVAELLGQGGYVVEATPAVRVSFSAATLIEAQYLEDNDAFDCDHCEPDRIGSVAVVAAADAELQALLDAWCDRFAHTFVRGNLFSCTRNAERVEAVAQHQPSEVI